MRSAGSLTARNLNSRDSSRPRATCHCPSRYTTADVVSAAYSCW